MDQQSDDRILRVSEDMISMNEVMESLDVVQLKETSSNLQLFETLELMHFYLFRCLHQEQELPSVQVIQSGEERCVHGSRRQRVRSQTYTRRFCRGECFPGVFSV